MGVVPIQIIDDFVPQDSGLRPSDRFELNVPAASLAPKATLEVIWHRAQSQPRVILCRAAVETWQDVNTLRSGGILPGIIKRFT